MFQLANLRQGLMGTPMPESYGFNLGSTSSPYSMTREGIMSAIQGPQTPGQYMDSFQNPMRYAGDSVGGGVHLTGSGPSGYGDD